MSLSHQLSHSTLEKICARFQLREIGAPYMELLNPQTQTPVGQVRIFTGEQINKLVYIGLAFPPAELDSHMLFAFTPPHSALPHFTLDAVKTGEQYAFHLDLIPRVDLGAHLDYINAIMQPLTPIFDHAKTVEGLTPAHLSPRQYALMSPWMLAYRANETAFQNIQEHVNAYLGHWFTLASNDLPANLLNGTDANALAERDVHNRAALFNPEVDPVWAQVTRLVGAETSERLRALLKNQNIDW